MKTQNTPRPTDNIKTPLIPLVMGKSLCSSPDKGRLGGVCVCCKTDISKAGSPHSRGWRKLYSGFSLIELIVVITILVILGTIAFINIGGFSGSARDGARISNLTNLKKGLDIYQIKTGTYPMPEGPVTINASGSTILGYQGFAKEQVGSMANLSVGGTKDPSDGSMYTTYSVNVNQTKMQVMSFLEDGGSVTAFYNPLHLGGRTAGEGDFGRWFPSLVPTAFASISSDYSQRFPTSLGDGVGILLESNTGITNNRPIQETGTGLDLVKTTTLSGYTMVFSKSDTTASVATSGTGAYTGSLFTFAYNKRDDLLRDKNVAGFDPSLLAYWDMETTTSSGWVADLSGHGNSGTGMGLQTIGGEQGIRSKATRTKSGSLAAMTTTLLMQTGSNFTVSFAYKINTYSSLNNANGTYQSPNLPEWNTYTSGILTAGGTLSATAYTGAVQIKIFGSPNITFTRGLSGGSGTILTGPHIDIGEWHISAIVYDGNIFKVYDNGVFMGTMDATGYVTPSTFGFMFNRCIDVKPPSLGSGNYGIYGDNTIDEARVYNRALSESEIVSLYGATR